MSQDVMANLYGTTKNNISMHLKNIFDEGELEKVVCRKVLDNLKASIDYHPKDKLSIYFFKIVQN